VRVAVAMRGESGAAGGGEAGVGRSGVGGSEGWKVPPPTGPTGLGFACGCSRGASTASAFVATASAAR
jgi:hypothetical protein